MKEMKIEIISTDDLVNEFMNFSNSNIDEVDLVSTKGFRLSSYGEGLMQLLTVGGGLVGLCKCVVEYLKLKNQTRRIKIKKKDGSELEIEANSVEEVMKIFEEANAIVIDKK